MSRWMACTKQAPVLHPTEEEFKDPMAYFRSIREEVEAHGMCKIVPPVHYTTQCFEVMRRDGVHAGSIKIASRQQLVGDKEWEDWDDDRCWAAPDRTLKGFQQAGDAVATKVFGTSMAAPPRRVEVWPLACACLLLPCGTRTSLRLILDCRKSSWHEWRTHQ